MPAKEKVDKWLTNIKTNLKETNSNMLVLIIFETKSNMTYEYQIMSDSIKEIVSKGILSRGKNIMPIIEERYLENMDTEEKLEMLVKKLTKNKKTIATMESCTGGGLASEITNISGASEILKKSYVTYCNEAKIELGVPKEVIEKHTVYRCV